MSDGDVRAKTAMPFFTQEGPSKSTVLALLSELGDKALNRTFVENFYVLCGFGGVGDAKVGGEGMRAAVQEVGYLR